MISSTIQTVLGETWLEGRLRYNYLNPEKTVAESIGYHENGQLRFKYPVLNDKLHGLCSIWYPDGTLHCEENYFNNYLHGIHKEWYPSGKLKKVCHYKIGKYHGERTDWYENGVKRLQCHYIEDQFHGAYEEWYGNGQIKESQNYVQGRRHGEYYRWMPDGRKYSRRCFVRGVEIPAGIFKLIESDRLTSQDILKIDNSEVRRIALEHLGYARFLSQVDHQVIERVGDQELVRIDWHKNEEPIFLVKVKCPSTGAFYTLRVPPDAKSIQEAIAWTFWLKPQAYKPEKET